MSQLLPKSPAPDLEPVLSDSVFSHLLRAPQSNRTSGENWKILSLLLNREAAKCPLKMWKVARVAKSRTWKCDGNAHSPVRTVTTGLKSSSRASVPALNQTRLLVVLTPERPTYTPFIRQWVIYGASWRKTKHPWEWLQGRHILGNV